MTQHVQEPKPPKKVFKNECMYTFDTPESENGLYVNLTNHQAFAADYVRLDHERTNQRLYLHQKWIRKKRPALNSASEKPDRLGINVEGGFSTDSTELEKHNTLAIIPEFTFIPLPSPDLPEVVNRAVNSVLEYTDASNEEEAERMEWEEERKPSKYANDLPQEGNGKKIPPDPNQWQCEESGERTNLWLNLSDGFIGSGRPQPDGSGGNGAALRHFEVRD